MQDYGAFEIEYQAREEDTGDSVHPDHRNTSRERSVTGDELSALSDHSAPEFEVRGAFYDFWN